MTIETIYKIFQSYPEISTDTRKITKGSIYFALKGDTFNGNLFAEDALSKGAAYAIVDEDLNIKHENIIKVDNALICLQQLANHHRKQVGIPVLAITGTNGKTTTKELVSAVLSKKFKLIYTQGNLNNHIGVPLTLLRIRKETEFAVIEMGANHPLEIKQLCEIAEPNFGLITNVGNAHLEGFGSFEGVKKTKGEMYDFLKSRNGLVFINAGNDHLQEMLQSYSNKFTYNFVNANITGIKIGADPYLEFSYEYNGSTTLIKTQLSGGYNFENAMAAVAIGNYFSIPTSDIKDAIESYKPENNRSQIVEKNGNTLFIDCYNANPSSMRASIENFAELSNSNKLLILGDMFELGKTSDTEHSSILSLLSELQLNRCTWIVGSEFNKANFEHKFKCFNKTEEVVQFLRSHPVNDTAILIKGSRGMRLEKILDEI